MTILCCISYNRVVCRIAFPIVPVREVPLAKRKRQRITPIKVAIGIVIFTTLLAMTASAAVAATEGRGVTEELHQLALVLMLMAYLFLIAILMGAKKSQTETVTVFERNGSLHVSPCSRFSVLALDQASVNDGTKGPLSLISKQRRAAIRVIVGRSLAIPESFLDSMLLFPNLNLLDLQDSQVPESFWDELEELDNLEHVLAANAMSSDQVREVTLSVPEVKFWLDRKELVMGTKTAVNHKSDP